MIVLIRLALVWIAAFRRKKLDGDGISSLLQRVWPGDLDWNMHMNNGRYFSAADIGRFDWWMRSGLWRAVRQRGWRPVAGDSTARFSQSLLPFQRYKLRTRMLGWTGKWFFAEHRFVLQERVCALIVVRYLFVADDGGTRPAPAEVMEAIGWAEASPLLPEWVLQWSAGQDQLSVELKNAATSSSSASSAPKPTASGTR